MIGCARDRDRGDGLDVDRVMSHVNALAQAPRVHDTLGARTAAIYITGALAPTPLEATPVGDVDLPAIEILGHTYRAAEHVHVDDPDLVARFGPTGKALLLMAHYDTVPGSPGAVDNAASCALLIELAKYLQAHPPSFPIMIAFTADEEGGLVGAEALAARHGDEVDIAIALDMVGGSETLVLNGASTLIGLSEMTWLAHAADRAGIVIRAPLPHRVLSRWWPQAERSDHGVFTRHHIRAFHLYNRGQDGTWIDTAYHSPRDTIDRVDRTSIDEAARLLPALVAAPPPASQGDGFWLPIAANTVVPRWTLLAADAVLAIIATLGLASLAMAGRARSRPRGAGVIAGIGCFAAAVAIAAALQLDFTIPKTTWQSIRMTAGAFAAIAGLTGLFTRVVARRFPWIGDARYLAIAIAPQLVLGLALYVLGAAELAWIFLVPAAALALATRSHIVGFIAVIASLLPAVLVLHPNQLLELAWNGFYPGVPIAVFVAFLAAPTICAAAWWWRSRGAHGPLGTFVLPLGCAVSAIVGILCEFAR
ncbi:MAG: M28 family metallopeptidase [Kofleriaceae bacterium]